jgi:hypothetical protein
MSKMFKKFTKQTSADIRKELARAHIIIAMLSIAIIVLLSLGAVQPVSFDQSLSAICVVLLSLVTFVSACMSYTLLKTKK